MSKLSGERGAGITVFLIFILDQALKYLFQTKNLVKTRTAIVKGLFYIVPPSQNPGIAFGLFNNHGRFFIIPALLAVLFIIFFYLQAGKENPIIKWGILLVLAGALSNLADRIIYGFVIDYLLLNKFPYSFNIADMSIIAGVGLIIATILKCKNQNAKLQTKS